MSDKLTTTWDTGKTVYAMLTNAAGQAINGTTPETPVEANRGAYALPLTELDLKQVYEATFPAVSAGVYGVSLWEQQGGSSASTDLWIGGGEVQWDGTNIVPLSSRLATAGYTAPDNVGIAAIKAVTDGLVQTDGKLWVLDDAGNPLPHAGAAVTLDLTQAVPTTNTAQTVGDALNAARAQGFGPWTFDPLTLVLTLYAADGVTPIHTFTLDSLTAPLSRV